MRKMFICLGKAFIESIPSLIKAIYHLKKATKRKTTSEG